MTKKSRTENKHNSSAQEIADLTWARNRLQNEIKYLLDAGKIKEAKVLKKQLAELIKSQRSKK